MSRDLALIGEAGREHAGNVPNRRAGVVLVIAFAFAGQQHVPGVVVVVVPLRAVLALRRVGARIEQARAVVVVFQHEVERPAGSGGKLADRAAELLQDRRPAGLDNGLHRVEAEPVEAIVLQPMQRVADGEAADFRDPIVDRPAPWRMRGLEKRRRIAGEIIPLGSEMVIDDVEKHHQPAQMRGIDQRLEVVRPTIGAVGGVEQHAVIAPIAPAGEIRERHQLDRSQSGVDEVIEPLDRRAEAPAGGEGAHMELEQGGLRPRPATPVRRLPSELSMIDDLARSRHVLRLEVRRGVRHLDLAVDAELVARAGTRARHRELIPAAWARPHGMGTIEHELDTFSRRRPQAEHHAIRTQRRSMLHLGIHAAPANASTERAGACDLAPEANSWVVCEASAVLSTTVQWLYSGSVGSLKSIASGAALRTT